MVSQYIQIYGLVSSFDAVAVPFQSQQYGHRVFMPPLVQTGRRHNVVDLSARSFTLCQTCERDILKTNEPNLLRNGTRGSRRKWKINFWDQEVKAQGHMMLKLDLTTWRKHLFDPFRQVDFLVTCMERSVNWISLSRRTKKYVFLCFTHSRFTKYKTLSYR